MSQEEANQIVRDAERRRRSLKYVLPTVAALGAGAAIAVGAIPSSGHAVFTGCYVTNPDPPGTPRYGMLRLIDRSVTVPVGASADRNSCRGDEATVSWGQQGPPGLPGQDGGAGPRGADGSVLVGNTAFGFQSSGDRFLKLDGIKGESSDRGHKEWIEISSFSIGAAGNIGSQSSGAGAGKVSFNSFTITKKVDKSSPILTKDALTGNTIDSGEVAFSKTVKGKPLDYLFFKYDGLAVSSVKIDGQQTPTEQVTFSFSKFRQTFQGVDSKGKKIAPLTITISIDNTAKVR